MGKRKYNIQNKRFYLVITAIVAVTFLDGVALLNGIDGVLLTTTIGTIVGLVALIIKTPKFLKM